MSKIEWTERTWNPIRGCSMVSAGCAHCYAMRQAHRFAGPGQPYEGLTYLGPKGPLWTGRVALSETTLEAPLRWRKPRRVFVNSMSDVGHPDIPLSFLARMFNVMASATLACRHRLASQHEDECWSGPHHQFQALTKRPEVLRERIPQISDWAARYWPGDCALNAALDAGTWPLPNVWLGVSVEDQDAARARIPNLLATPAAVRFVSYEPALGPVDFTRIHFGKRLVQRHPDRLNALTGECDEGHGQFDGIREMSSGPRVDWLICGGESGPGARPMHLAWARSVHDQCKAAGVPFFMKQFSGPGGRAIKDMTAFPADLRIREFPKERSA
mgnify:CR=1 FL=1